MSLCIVLFDVCERQNTFSGVNTYSRRLKSSRCGICTLKIWTFDVRLRGLFFLKSFVNNLGPPRIQTFPISSKLEGKSNVSNPPPSPPAQIFFAFATFSAILISKSLEFLTFFALIHSLKEK